MLRNRDIFVRDRPGFIGHLAHAKATAGEPGA
jgi:hypothetical protein